MNPGLFPPDKAVVVGSILGMASTFLAARHLGAWAAALVAGLGFLGLSLAWSRRVEHHAGLSVTDNLTGLGNDRGFRSTLSRLLDDGDGEVPLGLILVDVDQFKTFNDTFGHPAGDDALKAVGSILQECAGSRSAAFRLGGDEFAILLPAIEEATALGLAERSRLAIEAHAWPLRGITASLGVATLAGNEPDDGPPALIDRADRALYRAKRGGRNRVAHHPTLGPAPGGSPDREP